MAIENLKEIEKQLTDKQKKFCHEYVIDWNATRAAIKAGYSEKTAKDIGCENLAKPYIKAYIEDIQKDIAKLTGISVSKIINEHAKIAFSSIAHLHNTWIELQEFEQLTEEQKASIQEISTKVDKVKFGDNEVKEVEYVKIKLYDKCKALDSITKILGFEAAQKIESTTINLNKDINEEMTAEEASRIYSRKLKDI